MLLIIISNLLNDFYKVCNAASPLLNEAKATKSQVRKAIGSSTYKARDILAGTVQRKVKKKKIYWRRPGAS